MRRLFVIVTVLVLGVLVTGCEEDGDSTATRSEVEASGQPTADPNEELCASIRTAVVRNGKQAAAHADELTTLGPPAELTKKQLAGFHTYVGILESIDPKTTAKQFEKLENFDLTRKQEKQVQAFLSWASQTCL